MRLAASLGRIGLAIAVLAILLPVTCEASEQHSFTPSFVDEIVKTPDGYAMLLTFARSQTAKLRPAVLILHGSHGFADEYVALAGELTAAGYVAIAACWFAPGAGEGMRFVTPRPCPADAPPLVRADLPEAQSRFKLLLDAVAQLPGVDTDRIFVLGHSRGAVAALYAAINGTRMRGVILNSGAYPSDAVERAHAISVPMLILHGEKDSPLDGGSEMTHVSRSRQFATALRQAQKRIKTRFYASGGHNSLFSDRAQRSSEIAAIIRFIKAEAR